MLGILWSKISHLANGCKGEKKISGGGGEENFERLSRLDKRKRERLLRICKLTSVAKTDRNKTHG